MPDLPTGTVTFLYTDVEGSTRRWEQHGQAMRLAMERHDAVLRAAIEEHGGRVFRTVGDGLCAAFAAAPGAIDAALAAQRRLQAQDWGEIDPLRVRMALLSGEVEQRDGDYVGPALNRMGRLLAAGHGGQVLVSRGTASLAGDSLPERAGLRDLGQHRFRDLFDPEQVFQLTHPDLPSEFPVLRSLSARPNNLPLQATSFVGREEELTRVADLLGSSRLLTLTGAGGSGKTRLAIELAAGLLDRYPGGVWFVELAPLAQPELVSQTVATAMGLREEPGQPILTTLLSAVSAKHVLILLDNCEHLVEACACLADSLLRSCANLRLLATSREALAVPGETTWRVPPLDVPDPTHCPPPDELTRFEAVRLFIQRAQAVRPDFTITEQNAPAVADICHRLDGIPLALELAAARVKVLSPEQIAGRLDDRFRLLRGGSRTVLPRQQTLWALVDWSYAMLDEQQRALFRRLSVFAGGWTIEAAEEVCAGDPIDGGEVLDLLASLVDKSLVLADEQPDGSVRYGMLQTIREFGWQAPGFADEHIDIARRAAQYYLALALRADDDWQQSLAFTAGRVATERANLRAAWAHLRPEEKLRLASALHYPRYWAGQLVEDEQLLREALEQAPGAPPALRTAALAQVTHTLGLLGRAKEARKPIAESLRLSEGAAAAVRMPAVGYAIWLSYQTAQPVEASLWVEFLQLLAAQALPPLYRWLGLVIAGAHCAMTGDLAQAEVMFQDALALIVGTPDPRHLTGVTEMFHGAAYARAGDMTAAEPLLEKSVRLLRDSGDLTSLIAALRTHGIAADALGRLDLTQRIHHECLTLGASTGWTGAVAFGLAGMAAQLASQSRAEEAASVLGALAELCSKRGYTLPGFDAQRVGRLTATLQQQLGPAFEQASAAGKRSDVNLLVARL